MKRWWPLIVLILVVVAGALVVHFRSFFTKKVAGLEVYAEPQAVIFLDGQHLGQTPFEDKELKTGEYLLKLVPESDNLAPWEQKISLNPGVITVVKCQLAESEELSSGTILSLEPLKNKNLVSLAVISDPNGALVKINGTTRGFTPISTEDIEVGDQLISLSLPGYLDKEVKAKTVLGRKLIVDAKLAQEKTETKEATESAAEEESEAGEEGKPYVIIKDTPTGWLRVRLGPSTAATEAAKVKPGEKYEFLEANETGWYKIKYEDDKEGWVSGQYASKHEE